MAEQNLRDVPWEARYSREKHSPLHDFYIPALKRSVAYDRKAGYFSSTALSIAARGVTGLIRNGGHMRLLVSCRLSRKDIEAIRQGYDLDTKLAERLIEDWEDPADFIEQKRLEALAWMISQGTLEIKVGVPVDDRGALEPIMEDELFHEKVGIFTDAGGNQVVFNGSVNESRRGWLKNRESFQVFCSWYDGDRRHLEPEIEEFETLWADEGTMTRVYDFPEAVAEELLQLAPEEPPEHDPESEEVIKEIEAQQRRERWAFQFLRDAPYMRNGDRIADAFATVDLWPHQKKVADQIVETFPEPYLLCDEVGLGKTIEAGIALKRLLLTDRVKRCLILVPKAVLVQWQEELIEKFNLNTWRYTGKGFVDAHGNESPQDPENPWNTHEVIIASSHLAKRRDRSPTLLAADEWEIVVIDEAHHARRSEPTGEEYSPNLLLRLMEGLRERTRGMLLLTATPMQLDPIEVWDLMHAVGLGGKWGALRGDLFKRYFDVLRHFEEQPDLDFICEMLHDYLEHIGSWDATAERQARDVLGLIKTQTLKDMGEEGDVAANLRGWTAEEKAAAVQFFRMHTPLHHYVFRHTRDLLRDYAQKGLLTKNIPSRDVDDRFVTFNTDREQSLYNRIEDYIRDVYVVADEQNRSGVGFVMTIYRRRLTSSMYAIRESLKRRMEHLLGAAEDSAGGLLEEDYEDEELSLDIDQLIRDRDEPLAIDVVKELEYIDEFIEDIDKCGEDSKFDGFVEDLREALKRHNTVVVFTQYTDTLDYLREKLRAVHGSQVACYSGRGGERWNGDEWETVSKEFIKQLFAEGEQIKILLCTEAASEGLNLQTCSMLFNYDMPWNPMRVEQRIGRIDRIGQEADEVEVINYFYDDTVEARIHKRLGERIEGFNFVVGPLQPILAQLPNLIKDAAFTDPAQREKRVSEIVDELGAEYDKLQREALSIEENARHTEAGAAEAVRPPVSPEQIERMVLESELLDDETHFEAIEDGLYKWTGADGEIVVTFRPDVYDAKPSTARYLSYGDDAFSELLGHVAEPELDSWDTPIARLQAESGGECLISYYAARDGNLSEVGSVDELLRLLEGEEGDLRAFAGDLEGYERELARELEQRIDAEGRQIERYLEGRLASLRRDARATLENLLSIEVARQGVMDDDEDFPQRIDVTRLLQSHLDQRHPPYPPLVQISGVSVRDFAVPRSTVQQFVGKKPESLNASAGNLLRTANRIAKDFKDVWERQRSMTAKN